MLRAKRYCLKHLCRSFASTIENNPLYPDTREEFTYLKTNYEDKLLGRKGGYGARVVNKFVKSVKSRKEVLTDRSVDGADRRRF